MLRVIPKILPRTKSTPVVIGGSDAPRLVVGKVGQLWNAAMFALVGILGCLGCLGYADVLYVSHILCVPDNIYIY